MANQKETTNSYKNQVDKFTEVLTTAREMQQDWLQYGLNFIHIYVDDVDGDWLETWGNDGTYHSSILDHIKEFLVSNDLDAVRLRQHLGERSLFEIAVNLEECWQIPDIEQRLLAIQHLLTDVLTGEVEISGLADSLLKKLAEIL
ncbi:hypothetical protein [Nostoc sp. TCL26-01]|uniref:hypothetical protein n=1 Tax=Nostoc sp. TCL26-01 TaxID=2576904 RepID=UPI0015BA9941|nr:hypothetical protein [Nostoc sp. TCL26-01]QLE56973.1 hypothetical protein FD725_16480 [Nostoc sp. TCL26-01]